MIITVFHDYSIVLRESNTYSRYSFGLVSGFFPRLLYICSGCASVSSTFNMSFCFEHPIFTWNCLYNRGGLNLLDTSRSNSSTYVARLSLGKLLVNQLQVVKRTNTPLINLANGVVDRPWVFWVVGSIPTIHKSKLFRFSPCRT